MDGKVMHVTKRKDAQIIVQTLPMALAMGIDATACQVGKVPIAVLVQK
jgi:hypothetical protein